MKKQGTMPQTEEQDAPETNLTNKEIYELPNIEFKILNKFRIKKKILMNSGEKSINRVRILTKR